MINISILYISTINQLLLTLTLTKRQPFSCMIENLHYWFHFPMSDKIFFFDFD